MLGIPASDADAVDRTFLGRSEELARFRHSLEQMLAGRRQILTLSGEPGIGKTRCAEAFARAADEQGALVLWGRCYEEPGAPPYWPWTQILREFIGASSASEVRLAMDHGVNDIASIVPEVADAADATVAAASPFEPAETRFRMFDAIGRFFSKAAQQVPLVAVIDNLHWADAPSLALLEFLSHELAHARFLLIVTYRDNEVSRRSPLLHTLGGIDKDADTTRIRLTGLSQTAIVALADSLVGQRLPAYAIEAIHHQTDGNPLFVIELLKVLVEESRGAGVEAIAVRIPDGVREAIGRRLSRLSECANGLLSTASVLGRAFTSAEVNAIVPEDFATVLEHLEAAASAGIIERSSDAPGEYRFTHALIRETLYEEIPTLERLRLHGRVADALVIVRAGNVEPALTRIAHHYYEAAVLGHADLAAEYAERAAQYAARIHAYEEALTHYERLIAVLTLHGMHTDERIARSGFKKGQLWLYLGDTQRSAEALLQAAAAVRTIGNAEFLVDVVSELLMTMSDGPKRQLIPLLDNALALLPEENRHARAKAMAALAFALRSVGDHERIDRLVEQVTAIASDLGDAVEVAVALTLSIVALRGRPETLEQRVSLGKRAITCARGIGSQFYLACSYGWQALHLLEQGRVDASMAGSAELRKAGAQFVLETTFIEAHDIAVLLLRGEWNGLEERIEALRALGSRTRAGDADGVYGAQMFALNRDLGRLAPLEPLVRTFVASPPRKSWEPGLLAVCVELGLQEEASALLAVMAENDFARIPRDDMFAACLVYCTEACYALGDAAHAEALRRLLEPYADQTVNHPRAVCFGTARLFLAMLAAIAGDELAAREHFEAAVRRNRHMRAWPWLARTLHRYGAFLLKSATESDLELGRKLLAEANELSGRLSMASLGREIDRLVRGEASRTDLPDGLTMRELDVLQLIAIGRSNKDIAIALSISLNTVATHVRSILSKTHSANRTEAAAYARRHALDDRPIGDQRSPAP